MKEEMMIVWNLVERDDAIFFKCSHDVQFVLEEDGYRTEDWVVEL